jgi:voltage-gated potassium channel Kch
MKFLASEIAYLLSNRENRANLRALLRYLLFLIALITVFAITFHVIKLYAEGEQHSWITGFYWTLVVMSTLGFGDITFTSDIGRLFSIVVLLSGVVFLLVMLPFLFVRLFYAPWLEARVRLRAPRRVPDDLAGHVILSEHDAVAAGLIERLSADWIPYVVVEPDAARAAQMVGDGVHVVAGDNDSRLTYERLRTPAARLVLANCEDTTNTNITLTVREVAPDVPVVALAEEEDSVEILSLSGATTVLALKRQLGEYLANRVDAGRAEAHVVGSLANCRSRSWRRATRRFPAAPFAIRVCANEPARASSACGRAAGCDPRTHIRSSKRITSWWSPGRRRISERSMPCCQRDAGSCRSSSSSVSEKWGKRPRARSAGRGFPFVRSIATPPSSAGCARKRTRRLPATPTTDACWNARASPKPRPSC